MMNAIKTAASMGALWALSVVFIGVLCRVTWYVFLIGWNLL
jgi:hypothetical protein